MSASPSPPPPPPTQNLAPTAAVRATRHLGPLLSTRGLTLTQGIVLTPGLPVLGYVNGEVLFLMSASAAPVMGLGESEHLLGLGYIIFDFILSWGWYIGALLLKVEMNFLCV